MTARDEIETTSYVARLREALSPLCVGVISPEQLFVDWLCRDADTIQSWAIDHAGPRWATRIGIVEAARAMAGSLKEGIIYDVGTERGDLEGARP